MRAKFSADTLQGEAFAGYLSGLATTVSSKRYIGSVLDYSYQKLSDEFGYAMDLAAQASYAHFNHVYEWGDSWGDHSTVGNPFERLWVLVSTGKGNTRTIGFSFLPSDKPVPVHPILLEPGPNGETVKEGIHIFTWKAPIMEYGLAVTIKPELAKALAYVKDDEIAFSRHSMTIVPGRNGSIGSFTGFFLKWWGGGPAEKIFDNYIRPKIENDIASEGPLQEVISKYRTRKQVNVRVGSGAAFADGKRAAEKNFSRKQSQYIAAAAERRYDLYGD